MFALGERADVVGVSKGKGFAGVMKRHGFAGLRAQPRHPAQAPLARARSAPAPRPSRVFKGMRMAGQHGQHRASRC